MPAYAGSGVPSGRAPKLAKVCDRLSSANVLWYVRCRYSALTDRPGTTSCWMPTVQMRLYSRGKLARSGFRVGLVGTPKVVDDRGPISQSWAMSS